MSWQNDLPSCIVCFLSEWINKLTIETFKLLIIICLSREYYRGKYHCTIDLLFDWFGLVCFTNENINCQLSYSWFQTSQTGGQWYSDTSPFSISCLIHDNTVQISIPWSRIKLETDQFVNKTNNRTVTYKLKWIMNCFKHLITSKKRKLPPSFINMRIVFFFISSRLLEIIY